jgi:NAD(P)-dependent dehydrogenase (short-subunit alcohol dehydrogenase family)
MGADRHVAVVTGANHGIGAAVSISLARAGVHVLCTYLRLEDPADPGTPDAYRRHRSRDASDVTDEASRRATSQRRLKKPASAVRRA